MVVLNTLLHLLMLLSSSAVVHVSGFAVSRVLSMPLQTTTCTKLYISSFTKSSQSVADTVDRENPEENVQSYLKEPTEVEIRTNIDGTCLVSGLVNSKERSDQFAFDLLNNEDSGFKFSKLVAFCDDVKFAKKRLLSRSARYTGLLDKLDFIEAESVGAVPTVAQLDGVKSWLAVVESTLENDVLSLCGSIVSTAREASSVENVAILITNAAELDASKCKLVVESFKGDTSTSFSIAAVGKITETEEGKIPYRCDDFGTEAGVIKAASEFSREESLRMITEMLQLVSGTNKALSFSEVNDVNATETKLVKGLREAGYMRSQEIDHMIREGPEAYIKYVEDWKKENPDRAKGYTAAWWESAEFKKALEEAKVDPLTRKGKSEEIKEEEKDERTLEIEKIAREWAKREYFRQSMSRVESTSEDVPPTESEFIESIWDRALFEGEIKYRQMSGEDPDVEAELSDFKSRQKRKSIMMLKRAKEELAEILEEEDLLDGDDGLKEALTSETK